MNDPLASAEDDKDENKDSRDAGRFVPSEQRESVDSTRRSDQERRQDEKSFGGEEKRESPDRRKNPDRRELGLNITCKTTGNISSIEDWLDDNCQSGWNLVLQKIGRDLVHKHVLVMFETEEDRDIFLDKYLQQDE